MCVCKGYRYISVSNVKFLCLILWLGDTNDAQTDTDNAQRTKHDCIRLTG